MQEARRVGEARRTDSTWGVAVGIVVRVSCAAFAVLAGAAPVAAEPAPRQGQVVVVAGTGVAGFSGDGWDARSARVGDYLSLAVAPDGTVYLTDRRRGVRSVSPDGIIDSVPGAVGFRPPDYVPGTGDDGGTAFSSSNVPAASAVAPDGTLYVAGEDTIARVAPDGAVTVVAGGGDQSARDVPTGSALAADLYSPADLAVDAGGNLFFADDAEGVIRRVDPGGTITTIAGGGDRAPGGAQPVPATELNLDQPASIAVDSAGAVYFTRDYDGAFVGRIAPDGTYTTVAGDGTPGFSGDGGPAKDARFGDLRNRIAIDGDDNLYLSDAGNGVIRVITPDGTIDTLGPSRGFGDIAVGPDGDVYLSGLSRVFRLVRHGEVAESTQPVGRKRFTDDAAGAVRTVAGTGYAPESMYTGFEGTPEGPAQLTVADDGTLYFATPDHNRVGTLTPDGEVRELAKTGSGRPMAVAVADGELYVADHGNNDVRKVVRGKETTSLAVVTLPAGLAAAPDGTLVVTSDDGTIQRISADGGATVLAGGGHWLGGEADGKPATEADLSRPGTVTVGADGTVYFVEGGAPAVRAVGPDGVLRTVAGNPNLYAEDAGFAGDGGPATSAGLNQPGGLAVAPDGALYIADTGNHRLRRVGRDGVITTVAGTGEPAQTGDGGPAAKAALREPAGVAVDRAGNVYVSSVAGETVRRIAPDGVITTVARFGAAAGPVRATETAMRPEAIALDRAGTLYVAGQLADLVAVGADGDLTRLAGMTRGGTATGPDGSVYFASGSDVVRRYPDGAEVTVFGPGRVRSPGDPAPEADVQATDLAVAPDGTVYLADGERVLRLRADGTTATVVRHDVEGITVGQDGALYLADTYAGSVYRHRDGKLVAIAGKPNAYGAGENGDGGPATEAVVRGPSDVAVDRDGVVYISADDGIRRVDRAGVIETVLHPAKVPGTGIDHEAERLALDQHGNLYFTEPELGRVRVLVRPGELRFEGEGWSWFGTNAAAALAVLAVAFVNRRRLAELVTGEPSRTLA